MHAPQAAVALALFLLPQLVDALPRFAARVGAPCSLCHVDPAGGGMRSDFARNSWELTELPMAGLQRPAKAPPMDARVTDAVALGADLRLLFQDLRQKPADDDTRPCQPCRTSF